MQRILIIGAGLIGASLAYRLGQAGHQVTILDAATPASGASGASFGWINASFFHSASHFNLRAAGIDAHHRLDRDLGQTGTQWQGCLWWEEEDAAQDAMADRLSHLGYPVERLTRAQITAREPALAAPASALWFASEGAVDAAALTRRLLAQAVARVHPNLPATEIETTSGRVTGVHTAHGHLPADHVILAAGTACPALLAPLGLTLPMLHRPGATLMTQPIAARLSHILASPAQEVRQSPQGHLIAPLAASHQGDAAGTDPETALANLQALLPGIPLSLQSLRLANRPVPGDELPAVGATGIPGLSLAVMHSGVTLAPLVAELLTAEITTGTQSPLLAAFRPARFFSTS